MGAELKGDALAVSDIDPKLLRRAAVRVADQIAVEHPHELDELMPKLAGRQLAKDPAIAAGLLELIDALGLRRGLAEIELLQTREVHLEAELAIRTDLNQRLKGGRS
ncbi:hypothetical protein [Streptomyces sp. NPDC050564]|uniref:hypothetical protein n=1 Tax=Streptomyces sp. NPDC050564 TaxID=3365631 RepID=UPI00379BDB41